MQSVGSFSGEASASIPQVPLSHSPGDLNDVRADENNSGPAVTVVTKHDIRKGAGEIQLEEAAAPAEFSCRQESPHRQAAIPLELAEEVGRSPRYHVGESSSDMSNHVDGNSQFSSHQNKLQHTVDVRLQQHANTESGDPSLEQGSTCRICFLEAEESGPGREMMLLQCSCKGEMGVMHVDCASKWFGLRGSRICDVCDQEVVNLPPGVGVPPEPASNALVGRAGGGAAADAVAPMPGDRTWKEMALLLATSMIMYSVFFENIVAGTSNRAKASFLVAIPYGCLVGLLASFAAQTRIRGPSVYVFSFSLYQFAIVIALAFLFYKVINNIPEVALLLAALLGIAFAWLTQPIFVSLRALMGCGDADVTTREPGAVETWALPSQERGRGRVGRTGAEIQDGRAQGQEWSSWRRFFGRASSEAPPIV